MEDYRCKASLKTGKTGADLTGGKYMNIDQDDKVVHIPTPYDNDIIKLNQKLNQTYIGYGNGPEKCRQNAKWLQDANAASYGAANAQNRELLLNQKKRTIMLNGI